MKNIGRNFWLYRIGQSVSATGTVCGRIALAWWVLDRSGSPAQLAAIVGPALFIKYTAGVLFGPLGDMFDRRKLILFADIFRGCLSILLVGMFFFGTYRMGYIMLINICFALGSALFETSSKSIVPHLVQPKYLREAVRQGQTLMALGEIAGGIIGGAVVSAFGVGGAFLVDAISYFVASSTTAAIRMPVTAAEPAPRLDRGFLNKWAVDIKAGFVLVLGLPVLVGIIGMSMFSNFLLAPLSMEWTVLIKEAKNLPPWFLGAVYSSLSIGSIAGLLILPYLSKGERLYRPIVFGMLSIGLGIALMPYVPNMPWVWVMAFFVGMGSVCTEIPIHTQITLAMPDGFRSRVDTIIVCSCGIVAPLGTALAGTLMGYFGAVITLFASGVFLLCLIPCLVSVPHFFEFFRQQPEEIGNYLPGLYPKAFQS